MNQSQNVLRGRLAAAVRRHHHKDADRLRAELKASRAADYIRELLAYPSPSVSARCELAELLIEDPS